MVLLFIVILDIVSSLIDICRLLYESQSVHFTFPTFQFFIFENFHDVSNWIKIIANVMSIVRACIEKYSKYSSNMPGELYIVSTFENLQSLRTSN